MRYRTGDILKVKSKRFPYTYHFGIVWVKNGNPLFIHNSLEAKNDNGGSPLIQNLEQWIKKNKVLSVQRTNIPQEKIIESVERNKSRKFNLLTFNSEHFVTEIKDGTPSSEQVKKWLYYLIGLFTIFYLLNKNRMTVKTAFFTLLRQL